MERGDNGHGSSSHPPTAPLRPSVLIQIGSGLWRMLCAILHSSRKSFLSVVAAACLRTEVDCTIVSFGSDIVLGSSALNSLSLAIILRFKLERG